LVIFIAKCFDPKGPFAKHCILTNAVVYLFKRFVRYYPDDGPVGSKCVPIQITKDKIVLTVFEIQRSVHRDIFL